MAILKAFPGATWVGSKMPGKPWVGKTAPMVVLHTLEFNGWPSPDRWDAPAHLVYNPNTREARQYLPMDRAAYAVRDNPLEDDEPTFQVELWGKAANVPGYDNNWYQGVADLCQTFHDEFGIPLIFADFSRVAVAYPGATPDRMTDAEANMFTGFLGHCHMGLGTDTHWDPGRLNTDLLYNMLGVEMNCPWTNTTEHGEPWFTNKMPCPAHYSAHGEDIAWGVNTGVCNVPPYGERSVDVCTDDGTIAKADNNRDDFDRILTDGRWWVMKTR